GDAVSRAERLHAFQLLQEIEMPHGPAELAVGSAKKSDVRLLRDHPLDGRIFRGTQILCRDFRPRMARSRFFERIGTKQAADVIGAERGNGAGHIKWASGNAESGSLRG